MPPPPCPEFAPGQSPEPTVGLLNLMPHCALTDTERQWTKQMGVTHTLKFDDDPREASGGRSAAYLADCTPLSEAQDGGLDTLIITGANLELADTSHPWDSKLLPFEEISYIKQLRKAIEWAGDNTRLTVLSCLASHVALNHLFGMERQRRDGKTLGVYEHQILLPDHELAQGMGETIRAPHSRWGNIPTKLLHDSGVEVVAAHRDDAGQDAGWLLATLQRREGLTVFLQGHPEYDQGDLHAEYERDCEAGQAIPEGYYPNDDATQEPLLSWLDDRKQLFQNLKQLS